MLGEVGRGILVEIIRALDEVLGHGGHESKPAVSVLLIVLRMQLPQSAGRPVMLYLLPSRIH